MSVALLTADLMQSSQITGAATRVGVELRLFGSADSLCIALAAEPARLVIVDLALPALDIRKLITQLRTLPDGPPRTLAYGSHVHVERLATARDAGCDQVVSRGQFHAQMDQLLLDAQAP